jgi:hypothetical protein
MPPGRGITFQCVTCSGWVRTSAWSRYAAAHRCPTCFRLGADELVTRLQEAAQLRQAGLEQSELPDW